MSTNNNRIDITIHTPRHGAPRIPWFRRLATRLGMSPHKSGIPVVQVSVPAKDIKSVSVKQDDKQAPKQPLQLDVDRLLRDLTAQGGETR